ncbi:hypothetical protein FRC18_010415 [Serendipita sp. 400]|nr:hypothetical protein FRC18_010415 [Serendipita sp. 400]
MPLEACMLVIDNSEYMRNGDYPPNRFDAQADAVTTVFSAKVDSNPENTAGVMTMAGKSPEVLVTPTQDIGKILTALHGSKSSISGSVDVLTSISIAQLALKHRQNKNLRQRIIAFVGSPLSEGVDEKQMIKVGKKLKKNNVALDVVCFGETDLNEARLRALVESVQNNDNSHFLLVPASSHLMSDILLTSPVLRDPSEAGAGGSGDAEMGGGGGGFEFGFDPSLDPELAMALRMSVEEAQARQRNADATASTSAASTSTAGASTSSTAAVPNTENEVTPKAGSKALPSATSASKEDEDMEDATEDDPLLAQAIAMSRGEASSGGSAAPAAASAKKVVDEEMEEDDDEEDDDEEDDDEEDEDAEDEEAAIAKAIAMSMNPQDADEEEDDEDDEDEDDEDEDEDDEEETTALTKGKK